MSSNKSNITLSLFFCFLLLVSQKSFAQPQTVSPDRGFTPPGQGFMPTRPNSAQFDDDEEDDDETDDISSDVIRRRMEERMRSQAAGATNPGANAPNTVDISNASTEVGATTMRGGANTKIQTGSKGQNCLALDPVSGVGPDVVTNFDFPDADIVEIAKTLGRLTCINFIFDKEVRGKISVVSNSPITVGDAWKAFLTALDTNGFSLIPSGKYYRIARQREAKDKQVQTFVGKNSPNNDMYITRVMPLKYISADEVSRVFRNFQGPNTRIVAYDQTNTLIITDTGSNIQKFADMISVLDVETFDEKLAVIKMENASAEDIAKLIDQLLPGTPGAVSPGAPASIARFRNAVSARKTKEGGVISHIIPDDRTNSVIISANLKGLEQVKELIKKLDVKVTSTNAGSKINVLYLQYADAEQVAQTLSSLAASSGAGSSNLRPQNPIPGIGASPSSSSSAQLFEGAIKISADKPTNSLVITGSSSDFQTIQQVIAKLDVPRDQVYVEAVIMEMTVDKTFELGTAVASPKNGIGFKSNDLASFIGNPLNFSQGLVLGFTALGNKSSIDVPGTSQSVSVSTVQGLIKALQLNSNSNILSTPQILTLDNQEANIEVSEQVPVPVTTTIQGGSAQQSVSKENISLSLKIKPQINKASPFVKLDIDQKMQDISNRTPPKAVADLAFGTQTRTSKTTVVVHDGDTVALGGLVRDKIQETVVKVPLLGDIPILGWLFRSKTTNTAKQNLISFITPKIIKHYAEIRKVVDKKIEERDDFIEKNFGGEDVFREKKMKMINELPDVSALKDAPSLESSNEPAQPADSQGNDQPAKADEPPQG